MDQIEGKGQFVTQGSGEESAHLCGPCRMWEDKRSTAFCLECDDFVCVDCTIAHERIEVLRNHQLLMGKDMPKTKMNKPFPWQPCPCNSGMHIAWYCPKDDKLLCRDCQDTLHNKCSVISLKVISVGILDTNYVPDALKNLENLKNAFLTMKSNRQNDWIHLQQTESGILKDLAELKENVISVFDKLQLSVAQELVLKVNPEDVAIGKDINACSNIVNDIQGRIKKITEAVHSRNDVQIFSTVVSESQENVKYRDYLKKLNPSMESLTLKLDIKRQVQNFLQLTSLGELKVTKTRNPIEIPTVKTLKCSDYVKKI